MVDSTVEFCSVVQTGHGDMKVILAGEVDGIWDEYPQDPSEERPNYVELKTVQEPHTSEKATRFFEYKLCKIWAQSYLLGVGTIVLGYRQPERRFEELEVNARLRDYTPTLEKVRYLKTAAIPSLLDSRLETWDPGVSVRFWAAVLRFVRQSVGQRPGVFKVRGSPKNITVYRMSQEGTGEILPEEFKEWREHLALGQ